MEPAEVNIKITRGSTFRKTFQLTQSNGTPVNLSGCTLKSLCRKSHFSYLKFDLNPSVTDAANGKLQLFISGTQTSGIEFGFGVYDIEITYPNNDVEAAIYGNCLIRPGVTRGE